MASITTTGLGSGLDIESIVTGLVQAEGQAQANRFNQREAAFQSKLSAYGSFRSAASELRKALESLKAIDKFQGRTVTSGNEEIVGGTATSSAVAGSYAIEVVRLAAAHKLRSAAFASEGATVGTGTLTISTGGRTMTVDVAEGTGTLAGIRDAINGASDNPGVVASVVNGTAGAQLVLTSRATGASSAITVTQSGGDGGLAALAHDPLNGVTGLTEISAATDAAILVDGIEVTSSTNEFGSAIVGLTISAVTVSTPGTTTLITVGYDTDGARKKIEALVGAYNSLVDNLKALSSYDPESKVGGPLLGDATLREFTSAVSRMLSSPVSGLDASIRSLSDLGVTRTLEGTLQIDTSKLDAALKGNLDGVGEFFADTEAGLAKRLDTLLERYVTAGGALDTRIKGLQASIEKITDDREALSTRLTAYEARLRAQFNALDSLVARLRSTSDFLTQQLANLPGSTPINSD